MIFQLIQYALPLVFIYIGIVIKRSNDPRFQSAKKIADVLILVGVLTLIGRIILDYFIK